MTDGNGRRVAPEWREMRKRGGSFGAHRDSARRWRPTGGSRRRLLDARGARDEKRRWRTRHDLGAHR
ncbi:hypothetical protein E2562_016743 [Oryza meyeriana var. granulata]|uniref:Uncharacterized protein n=1 Tax=Oryza meyeriana var. granulata TaxID=110450 RepID=A0A6G1BX01_9ORYZ|nr:hypothetical protein E2562_016743 [Oryza meyeriana var. granulata]